MWISSYMLFSILIGCFKIATCEIDMIEYYKMPPLHRQDDYERCLWSTEELSTYCTVSTLIKPDPSNAIWNQIEEFSNQTKVHFAHDVLFTGFCLSECQKILSELSEEEREELYVAAFPHTRKFTYDITAYKNGTLYRKMYDKIFNQCENLWLRKNWNLSGYSTVLWCTTNQEFDHYETDYLYTLFLVVTFIIVAIVATATGLDIQQNKKDSLQYYKVDRRDLSKSQQCLLCFSLVRNWYRLVAPPKTEAGRDLRFVLTIRYLTTLCIVAGHVLIAGSITPSINPNFIENSYYSVYYGIFNSGYNIVQTFFIISGALLYFSFRDVLREGSFNLKYLGIAVIYRYIRLTPPYAYLILFHSTYFLYSGSGLFSKFYLETEYTYCRRNWWTNLLYINNYVNANQECIVTSWYLSADTQLFLFALFLFMIMWKYPKYKYLVLVLAFGISCAAQFTVNYLNGFDAMFLMSPEVKRFVNDNESEEFLKDYITSHTNGVNFIIGIFLAIIYMSFKKNKYDFSKYKSFIVFWHLVPPAVMYGIIATGRYISHNNIEKPSISIALFSLIARQSYGISSIILAVGFFSRFRSPLKNVFHWPVFTPLSRLTYCIYLCHVAVLRVMHASQTQSLFLSTWVYVTQSIALLVVSHVAALVLCLCIEFPVTGLIKNLLNKDRNV